MTTPLLHAASFEGREGAAFRVSSDSPPLRLELTLTSVTTWGPEATDGGRQPFTILLHGPLEPVLPQRIYRFDHPEMQAFDIFIVPVGPDRKGMRYEAVFA